MPFGTPNLKDRFGKVPKIDGEIEIVSARFRQLRIMEAGIEGRAGGEGNRATVISVIQGNLPPL